MFDELARQLVLDRERLSTEMASIPGIRVWPSRTNFVLFRTERCCAADVHAGLMARGILIKDVSNAHPMLQNCLRVTMETTEEIALFLAALRELAG